jgi:hypothetical protein
MYIVDTSKLSHPDDVKKDNFGKWKHIGSPSTSLVVSFSNDNIIVRKPTEVTSGRSDMFTLRRLYSNHPSNPEFRRIIVFAAGMNYE